MSALGMRRTRHLLPLAAALVVAVPLAAQEPRPEPEPEDRRCLCFGDAAEGSRWPSITVTRRARLGVALGEPTAVAGRQGVRLEAVPEGTPARRAGLREGDVVVALNGTELGSDPASALVTALRAVEPGDTVTVTFTRDDDRERTVRVITDASPSRAGPGAMVLRPGRIPLGEPQGIHDLREPRELRELRELRNLPGRVLRHLDVRRDGLDLTALNADLGEYFGAERGVLVTAVEDASPLGLRAGDVILAVGGREVRDPAHVRSILASYRPDEEITFRIVRKSQNTEVTGRRP